MKKQKQFRPRALSPCCFSFARSLFIFTVLCAVVFFGAPHAARAAVLPLDEATKNFPAAQAQKLANGEALSGVTKYPALERLRYLPNLPHAERVKEFVQDVKPTILYETTYFIPEKNYAAQSAIMAKVFNYFRAVEQLPQVRYRNIKNGFVHPVFGASRAILSLRDPAAAVSPALLAASFARKTDTAFETAFVLQDMPPFGEVRSSYRYEYGADMMLFWGLNETPVVYKSVHAVAPREMLSAAYIARTDKGVLIYGIGAVRISGIAVLFRGVISNSFESRMVGLFDWIKNGASGAPQLQ